MRRLMKFLHTLGAVGMMGSMACLLVLLRVPPAPTALAEYALMREAMGAIATWIFLPSLGVTLVAGMLAMALNPAYHNAGWVGVKLATGILVFEYGFMAIQGPIQQEAERSAQALAGQADVASLAQTLHAEQVSLWVMLG